MTSLCFFLREERAVPSPKGLCHQNITVLLYSVVEVQKNLEEIQIKSRIEAPCASRSVLYVPGAHAGQLAPPEPRALQPRPALRRLWAVSRLSCLGLGAIYAGSSIADYVQGGSNYDHSSYAAVSVAFLLCAALYPRPAIVAASTAAWGDWAPAVPWRKRRRRSRSSSAAVLPTQRSNARRSSFVACPPAGCTPRTSRTNPLHRQMGQNAPRAHGAGGDGGSNRLSEPLVE